MYLSRSLKSLAVRLKQFVNHFHSLDRETVARIYLKGEGIEIGALHNPLSVPSRCSVRYVDEADFESLKKKYPEIKSAALVVPDIIDDGEKLSNIADASQDFVIASEFLEHCQNPIGAIENFLRVLRPGGILYLAIPDKRYTFDRDRPITSLQHLIADYEEGPDVSRKSHIREWLRIVGEKEDLEIEEALKNEKGLNDWDIHWHVWTMPEMLDFILAFQQKFGYETEFFCRYKTECIFVLRKKM